MPRIPDHFIGCSFYVYPSLESAQRGERFGGSGFLVHVPSVDHERWLHVYAVTNKHVLDSGSHVLRLNTYEGQSEIIQTRPDSWIVHPDGDDIAVTPIEPDSRRVRWFSIGTDQFVNRERVNEYGIGLGDDTFLIGRLVTLEGRQRNTPVVRFGNISMLPDEPINVDGHDREAFLVECRSLSGFSGSPVFVTLKRTFHAPDIPKELDPPQPEGNARATLQSISGSYGPWLLGVDFAHMPLWKPVFERDKKTKIDSWVDANTGIACVVPAWKLLALLENEEFVTQRKIDDQEIARQKERSAGGGQQVE